MARIQSYGSYKGKKSKVPWHHMPTLSSETQLRGRTHLHVPGESLQRRSWNMEKVGKMMSEGKPITLEPQGGADASVQA